MKRAVALLALTLCSVTAAPEPPVAEVSQLRLYSSFWQNLHHFLYVSAWATRPVVPRAPRLAMPLPADPVVRRLAGRSGRSSSRRPRYSSRENILRVRRVECHFK